MKTVTHKMVAATIVACILFTTTFAQNALTDLIRDSRGTTNHFTTLDPQQQVKFNVADARLIFGLNSNSDLVLINTEADQIGSIHYRYYQTYAGYPIENSMFIAHTKNGVLTGMSGSIVVDFDSQMDSRSPVAISDQRAIQTAMQFIHAEKYAWQDPQMEQRIQLRTGNAQATYYPSPVKVWYNAGDDIDPRALRLAYKVDIYSVKPFDRKFVFVDAQTGRVLGTKQEMEASDATGTAATAYSGTQTIHSDLNGSSYRLRDLTKGNGIITLHASGHTDYTNSSPNWALSGADQYALDAHFGVAATWTYYKNNFNRNSVDNNGYALTSWVNDASNTDNADWDGSEMDYGNLSSNGHGITAIDVTGHELTHGVTQYTCNLTYSNESGAMNESMSDCMGKSVQFYTKPSDVSWILSNDMSWEIRNMSNPNADAQPDTYKGTDWYSGSSDNGGVHTNSGVGNFMFYLMVTGGSGTNDIGNAYSVSGLGLTESDQILYRTETVYLTSSSKYADWRTACINAATDLYGASSNEVTQVENAWYAVGIGTAGGGGGSCGTPSGLSASSITSSGATVSWGAVSGAVSYNLQYKISTSSTWTTVTGITTTSRALTGLSASTTYNYEVQTVCSSGSSSYSAVASFTTSGTGGSYCASKGTSTAYEYINKVAIGSISNTSGNNNGYADYTSLSTSAAQGSSQSITLTPGFASGSYTEYWTIYIDYNHNGILNDAGETITGGSGAGAVTKTFTVPSTATLGSTRMRIQMHYGSASTDPCATLDYGEVEDYTVNITAGSSCGTPGSLASSNITSSSATVSWGAVSGATSYNLQYKVSTSSTWTTVSGITTTSSNLTGLSASTTYNYQVQSVCSGGSSSYSAASSFTTSSGTVTYCASKGTSTTYEYINKVALGSISNTSGDNAGYGNYTNLSTSLTAGVSNTITLTPGFHGSAYTEYWTVYIDYNQNGVLNDAGEIVATGSGTAAISKSFTVPTTAKNGATRMRIQMHYSSSSTNPCATLDYGEVEDYTVNISGGTRLEDVSGLNSSIAVYPNPVNNSAKADYQLQNSGNVTLKIVDMYGREWNAVSLGNETEGSYSYALSSINSLASGNYMVLLFQNDELIARTKFMVVK